MQSHFYTFIEKEQNILCKKERRCTHHIEDKSSTPEKKELSLGSIPTKLKGSKLISW